MQNLRETPNVSDRKSDDQRPSAWMCEILMPVSGPVVAAYPIYLPCKGDVASCSLIISIIWASLNRLFRLSLRLRKLVQTLHQTARSFRGQVTTIHHDFKFILLENKLQYLARYLSAIWWLTTRFRILRILLLRLLKNYDCGMHRL
jgi:hypothetical protein